ncbi:hypothetical protein Dimus_002641 [Dionaea muscipula]
MSDDGTSFNLVQLFTYQVLCLQFSVVIASHCILPDHGCSITSILSFYPPILMLPMPYLLLLLTCYVTAQHLGIICFKVSCLFCSLDVDGIFVLVLVSVNCSSSWINLLFLLLSFVYHSNGSIQSDE